MSAPRDHLDCELLSTCLDGELTADEHAQLDRLLAEDPAMVQLLDEFRAIGSMLRELPRYTLGEDISGHVLRMAN